VRGAPEAWTFAAPRAEPARFLPYLTKRLRATIEQRDVATLNDVRGDVVVNCTGLAARELANDGELVPLFGQTLICEPGGFDMALTITDARDDDAHFYVIPRRDELVVGGCSIPKPPGTPPVVDDAITQRILRQARELDVPIGPVRTIRAGLRPYRREVRLERDGRIVHNYGHGGAGFTLCRGCAEDVADLIT
jgi:D-amino-acid oxidase